MTRVCFVSQVKPHLLAHYRARHAQYKRDTGWQDYRLFLSPTGLLVGTVTVDNYADAQARMALTEVNARWQAEMAEFFVDNPNNPDEAMEVLEEVFNLDEQLAASGLNN